MLSFLAMAFGLAASAPGELKVHQNWIVGCDSISLSCHATSLWPEAGTDEMAEAVAFPDTNLHMSIRRLGGVHGEVRICFLPNPYPDPGYAVDPSAVRSLTVRGARNEAIATLRLSEADVQALSAPAGLSADLSIRIARMLGDGDILEVTGADGENIANISLRGVREAMRHMDIAQHRIGNVTALVERGDAPAYRVPLRTPYPRLVVPPLSPLPPVQPKKSVWDRLIEHGKCDGTRSPRPETESIRLDADTTLLLVISACAAYNNQGYVYAVANDGTVQPAILRIEQGGAPLEQPIVGVWWEEGRLHSFGRGHPLAVCGDHQVFAWDGREFALVEYEAMGACRGSTDYITLFRRPVVEGSLDPK